MAKKKRAQIPPIDPKETLKPTDERQAQGAFEVSDTGTYVFRDVIASLPSQFEEEHRRAAEKFYEHWYMSGLYAGPRSVDLNRIWAPDPFSFGRMPSTEMQAFHRMKYRQAVEELGMVNARVVQSILCEDASFYAVGKRVLLYRSPESAIVNARRALFDALGQLVNLWGLDAAAKNSARVRSA